MVSKKLPLWLFVLGLVLAFLSAFADTLGLGAAPGFGWKQAVGAGVGFALVGVSWLLVKKARRPPV